MIVAIVLGFVLLGFLGFILVRIFRFAFVRADISDVKNLDSDLNKPLQPYRETIEKGYEFLDNQPCSQVYTTSFDGLRLAARYYKNGNSCRTVIIFHGYRSDPSRDFSCAVEEYYNMGLNVLMVDQRAHGKSEGKYITFGVKERRDVLSWINYVLENENKEMQIFLGGMSMGATTVLLSAGLLLPQNVKGIIADCGYTSPVDIIKKVAKQTFKIKGTVIIPLLNLGCMLFAKFNLYGISTLDTLKHNKIPLLFIHGVSDNFVPVEMSKRAYESADGKKSIVLVESADHGLSYLLDTERVKGALEKFISENSN